LGQGLTAGDQPFFYSMLDRAELHNASAVRSSRLPGSNAFVNPVQPLQSAFSLEAGPDHRGFAALMAKGRYAPYFVF